MSVVDVPAFRSLAESRAFFEENPHLNPAKSNGKTTHENASYVKSKYGWNPAGRIPAIPHAITDVFLQEQFDAEGDTVWALWGRGLSLTTYSISEVEHALSTVLTVEEQQHAAARRSTLRGLIVRLEGDAIVPADEELRPALQVVTQAAVVAAVEAEQPDEADEWKPAADHPWRKPKREVAA